MQVHYFQKEIIHHIQYEISTSDAMAQLGVFYWLPTCLKLPGDSTINLASPRVHVTLCDSKEIYAALSRYFNRISSVKLLMSCCRRGEFIIPWGASLCGCFVKDHLFAGKRGTVI